MKFLSSYLAPQGGGPDFSPRRQVGQGGVPGGDEGVPHVLPGQVAGQDGAGGQVGGDVL